MSDQNKKSIREQREELEKHKELLASTPQLFKPMFGMMFWQFVELESEMSPEDLLKEAITLTLADDNDEAFAGFMSLYVQLWDSARDFHAASRFIADSLGMTANELIEARAAFMESK